MASVISSNSEKDISKNSNVKIYMIEKIQALEKENKLLKEKIKSMGEQHDR